MWGLVFLAAFGLYLATCQRTVSWQDSGVFQWRVLQADWRGRLGLASAHPLYIAAGRGLLLFGERNLPFLLNAFSGLGMAVALANLAVLGTLLSGKRWIGILIAATLALAHTAWWLATIAETYTWSVAGLTAELLLLTHLLRRPRWWVLTALALVNGLGLCVHNFALLPLPVYLAVAVVLIARRTLPARALAAAAGAWILGGALYLTMILQLAVQENDLLSALRSALFGNYSQEVLNAGGASKYWLQNAVLSAMNFINLLLPLAVLGWVRLRRRLGTGPAAALGAITLIHVAFFVRYPVPDQFTFILPSLVLLAIAAAVGLGELADRFKRLRAAAV
jgi:hypothetical protein